MQTAEVTAAVSARTRQRYARVSVGVFGVTSVRIPLDKGVGAASFRKLCGHPGHWFVDEDGRHIRATSIVAFTIVDEKGKQV